mgnify:CR=1 FL=1
MDTNKIHKPEITKATTTQIQEMNTVITRIVDLIKEKHL